MSEAVRLIRERLRQADERLAEIERERTLWLAVRDGDRRLLEQIEGGGQPSVVGVAQTTQSARNGDTQLRNTKWPGAIREILQAANGGILTTQEIYDRAVAGGVTTSSSDPLGQVDWNIAKMIRERTAPIERVRTGHYRWATS